MNLLIKFGYLKNSKNLINKNYLFFFIFYILIFFNNSIIQNIVIKIKLKYNKDLK